MKPLVLLLCLVACASDGLGGDGDGENEEEDTPSALSAESVVISTGPTTLVSDGSEIYQVVADGAYLYYSQFRYLARVSKAGGLAMTLVDDMHVGGFAVYGGRLYFLGYDGVAEGIFVAGLDGSSRQRLVTGGVVALAVDASGIIYLERAETSEGQDLTQVRRLPLADGSPTTLATLPGYPEEVRLDASFAFAMARDHDANGAERSTIWRVPLGGGSPALVVRGLLGRLRVDTGELFYDAFDPQADLSRVWKVPVGGGESSIVVSPAALAGLDKTHLYYRQDEALKRQNRTTASRITVVSNEPMGDVVTDGEAIYWDAEQLCSPYHIGCAGDISGQPAKLKRLLRADVRSGSCDTTSRGMVATGAAFGLGATGTWVYYADGTRVRRIWRNGGAIEDIREGEGRITTLSASSLGAVWVEDTAMGWRVRSRPNGMEEVFSLGTFASMPELAQWQWAALIATPTEIRRMSLWGRLNNYDSIPATNPVRLAVRGDELYWTQADGTVWRVHLGDESIGTPEKITKVPGEVGDLALGTSYVYVATATAQAGALYRALRAGGNPVLLAQGAFDPYDLDLDGSYLYFTSQGPGTDDVFRVPSSGGTPQRIAARIGTPWELDTVGSCVYYSLERPDGTGTIVRVAK